MLGPPQNIPGQNVAGFFSDYHSVNRSTSPPRRSPSPEDDDPNWLGRTFYPRRYTGHMLHPTLAILRPRPGEPGSRENPGTVRPGPSQHWLASVFHLGFIPIETLRRKDQLCNEKTICEEGTCCLQRSGSPRLCQPTAKRGEPCTPRSLTNVYLQSCFCGFNQGEMHFV
ncbi:uncharacterized protein LOC125756442 [Rhipicephalus sanguineus]|uniref:uncharacterized protein LOC125756442 n=1 Tax=Rhipicephalus sanguineus TaxID=34632 RepID=UPI0020C29ABF|nr:uncharacterized protein LOC125756442 [Rhipicephalus sanguineus]